jgi:hypothetical protein
MPSCLKTNDKSNEYRDAREAKDMPRKLPKTSNNNNIDRGNKQQGRGNKEAHQRSLGNKKMKSMIAAAVAEALTSSTAKAESDATADKQFQDYIAALVDSAAKKPAKSAQASATVATLPAVSINAIFGRIKMK